MSTRSRRAPPLVAPVPARVETLDDYLRPGLRLVIVGINPSVYSATRGHYYARPGNLFWPMLFESGLLPEPLTPDQDARVLEFGIGLTDIVKRATPGCDDVDPDEFREGAKAVREKLRRAAPAMVCCNGLIVARYLCGLSARPGPQPEPIEGLPLWVVPSTSRRNAAYGRAQVLEHFRALALALDARLAARPSPARPPAPP